MNMHPRSVFTTLDFLCNVCMGPISWSIKLQQAGNACQEETL